MRRAQHNKKCSSHGEFDLRSSSQLIFVKQCMINPYDNKVTE